METVLLGVAFMGLIMLAMAVGVIFRREPLRGSCGGVIGVDCFCYKEDLATCDVIPVMKGQVQGDGVTVYESAPPASSDR